MNASKSFSTLGSGQKSPLGKKRTSLSLLISILVCLLLTQTTFAELKKCNRELLKYFNLKGNAMPVETKMLICPGIKDNCCNVTDELNIFTLWHNYTVPKMNRHVDDLLILYNKILKRHHRILALDTAKIKTVQVEDEFVMYPLKICERSLAALMPSSAANSDPDLKNTETQVDRQQDSDTKSGTNKKSSKRILNIDSKGPTNSFNKTYSKEIHRSESRKVQHRAQRMLSLLGDDQAEDEMTNLKSMMGGMSGSMGGGDAALQRMKIGFKSDFAKNLSMKTDHDLDKYRGKSPQELQAKLSMMMVGGKMADNFANLGTVSLQSTRVLI